MLKILPESAAASLRAKYAPEQIVFTNGCFDILHVGHVRYLETAKELGGRLVIGLNSDRSVQALKGVGRPINDEADRAEVLAALAAVDHVIIFNEPRVTGRVKELRPHVYTKGGDYTIDSLNPEEVASLHEAGAQIKLLPLAPGSSTNSRVSAIQ